MNDSAPPRPKLRWYQFSLRTLLVLVTLFAIPCSWIAVKLNNARRQQTAVTKLGHCAKNVKTKYGNVVDIRLNYNASNEDLVHLQLLFLPSADP